VSDPSRTRDAPSHAAIRAASPPDLAAVLALLSAAALPAAGVPAGLDHYVVAELGGELVGVAGLEPYGSAGLLRSVAVSTEARGAGLGGALVERVASDAAARGIRDLFLLTTTAERYFRRHGFRPLARDTVPERVRASVEFQGACPASAVCMHRRIRRIR
jgi:amino-acid N-acetyltransferase